MQDLPEYDTEDDDEDTVKGYENLEEQDAAKFAEMMNNFSL